MADLGADYSFARPGGAALKAAGVTSVGRYLGVPRDGRQIEKPEYDDLTGHGLSVWFVREGAASGMLGGRAKGVSDATIAVANLERLGLPGSVVYAAADWDVQDSQFGACDEYLRGFASVVGATRTGIYGGLHYLNHAHAAGLAAWFWQAGATSWNHRESPAMTVNIEQTTRTPPCPGTDHNFIYTKNHGQAGAAVPEEEDDMKLIGIRNHDGSLGLIDSAGVLHPISDIGLWNSYVRLGIVQQQPDGSYWLQQTDGTVWNALTVRTAAEGQKLTEIHSTVTQPVTRDGQPVPQAVDNMNTGTLVRHLAQTGVPVDVNAVAAAVIAQLPAAAGSLTQEQVKQAVIDGVSALTIKATV